MYAATGSNGMPIAVLKAAIGGNLYRNGRYHDEWVDPERTKFRYYLQEEPETINYEFSKEGNKAIFDGLITDIPVPIYLFVKKKYESKYEYVGIFEANSLSSDRKWFSLVESEHRQDFHNFYDYQKFVAEYLNSNFIEIAENTPILFEKKIPSQSKLPASRQPLEYFENRNPDYMQLREKLKILGNFGEEKALQYEKNRVKSFAPEYAGHVIKVDNDREGFDIRSYRLDGKQIKELKIEVKTTTNSCGTNPFFMSSNEMNVMKMNGRDYWLYRLFNIHSTQPSFYAFRGNVEQMIKFEPSEYLCSI